MKVAEEQKVCCKFHLKLYRYTLPAATFWRRSASSQLQILIVIATRNTCGSLNSFSLFDFEK